MEITITINCDNVAFADDLHGETARILRVASFKLTKVGGLLPWGNAELTEKASELLRDVNGNTVGAVTVTP